MILGLKPETSSKGKFSLDYDFSSREVAVLAHYFRNNQESIPKELDKFAKAVETAIYSALTLDEASEFFNENEKNN